MYYSIYANPLEMRRAFLSPFFSNIGDKMILAGAMKQYGPGEVWCFDSRTVPPACPSPDLIVVCGTPFLWDQCASSEKYSALEEILNAHRDSRKIAVGLGSCFPMHEVYTGLAFRQDHARIQKLFGPFEKITCRDRLIYHAFRNLGLRATLEPCPSVWATKGEDLDIRKDRDVYCAYDAMSGLSRSAFLPGFKEKWEDISRVALASLDNPIVIVVSQKEVEWARNVLGVEAECVAQTEAKDDPTMEPIRKIMRILAQANRVISGRVHIAIPAASLAKDVTLLGVDSRVLTVEGMPRIKSVWVGD